ncbi:GlxA family transcriptional regulator [Labrenzia sp. PHM005]|uniref:GlxA family transcriptional regulator n=1 Tax=Labrenzia sp. PHM005 TaxID=2590016 RepID=UPI00113FCFC8|nr:GlxA family transcriptional regulator [Labrenzia sp. PHM005]QDG75338.1 GlxA family transcriptional regulator [Labrenzia sp. PHM005]
MTRRIEFLAYEAVQILDITGPLQVFASANDLLQTQGKPTAYDLETVAKPSTVKSSSGLALIANPLPQAGTAVDTVLVPGGFGIDKVCEDRELISWLTSRAATARRVASVCSGAFLLATAGLLDGKYAATHWQRCAEFKERFPDVRLKSDPIYVQDGNLWTSAGITAGIDLALALVQEDLGREIALGVARQLVVFLKRPGGQSQFSAALDLQNDSGRFDQLHSWMMQNLQQPITLNDMAEQAVMSPRTLSRHYKKETGRSPMRTLEEMRLDRVRHLLEQGRPVAQAATRSGFGTEETLRQAFHRRFGVSPQAYRERFSN